MKKLYTLSIAAPDGTVIYVEKFGKHSGLWTVEGQDPEDLSVDGFPAQDELIDEMERHLAR